MSRWYIKNKKPKEPIDYKSLGLNEMEYQILLNRGLDTSDKIFEYLHPGKDHLHSPILMQGMIKAGNIVRQALTDRKRIRIVGDYDVDGVMSTSILLIGLKNLGFDVDFVIPHRVKDGYGINRRIIDEANADKIDLIITCDNGISAHEEIEYCKELGIDIIITDHHDIPKTLVGDVEVDHVPSADVVINPKQESCKYPFKNLSGGCVAYKFIEHLYTIFGKRDEMDPNLLGFAAISTICDVMILLGENRSIVSLGLDLLNKSENPGIITLKKVCGISGDFSVYHFAFVIGPSINSAGRLESAEKAVELFLTRDYNRAESIARDLRELNSFRQELTDQGINRIEKEIQSRNLDTEKILLLLDEEIHESIAGIIAGRIKQNYNRPTIVMAKSNNLLKGSGRSIEGFNIIEEIREHKDLLVGFGGHPMACGLSMDANNFQELKNRLINSQRIGKEDLIPIIRIDAAVRLSDVSIPMIRRLESFAPFGNGNESPVFGARGLAIGSIRLLGQKKNVLSIELLEGGKSFAGILFSDAEKVFEELTKYNRHYIDIVYAPRINVYKEDVKIQFEIKNYRISENRW